MCITLTADSIVHIMQTVQYLHILIIKGPALTQMPNPTAHTQLNTSPSSSHPPPHDHPAAPESVPERYSLLNRILHIHDTRRPSACSFISLCPCSHYKNQPSSGEKYHTVQIAQTASLPRVPSPPPSWAPSATYFLLIESLARDGVHRGHLLVRTCAAVRFENVLGHGDLSAT